MMLQKWRKGKDGTIVCDRRPRGIQHHGTSDWNWYGGWLVAETIATAEILDHIVAIHNDWVNSQPDGDLAMHDSLKDTPEKDQGYPADAYGCTAMRPAARLMIQHHIEQHRIRAEQLEALLRALPMELPPQADHALYELACRQGNNLS